MPLDPQQIEFYESHGYLLGVPILDGPDAALCRARFDALEAREGREKCQIGLLDRHRDETFVWELAADPRVLDAVESLLGPDILLLATHFFCKYGDGEPFVESFVAWHQDVTYWGLDPPEALTVWYAIDDSDIGNGCMRVIPGSHRGGLRAHGTSAQAGNLLSINQEVPVSAEEERSAVDLILRAGEASIHHGALIHGSLPNRSGRRRCGLTMRYVTPLVRPVALNSQGRQWAPVLVRGKDAYGHFGDTAPPAPLDTML